MNKTSQKTSPKSDYTGEQIVVLEGLDPVKKRPAMYIGSTSLEGVHHIAKEIVDNSIDEALAMYAENVWIVRHQNDSITVADDGRGIPIDVIPKYKKPALEIVMTKLHAGGKFDGGAYKVSGGLHGVGSSVVNALSQEMQVFVKRNGKIYSQKYQKGLPKTKVKPIKKIDFKTSNKRFRKEVLNIDTGTISHFLPDKKIFTETIELDWRRFSREIKERAYLISGLFFHLYDEKTDKELHYYFDGGILSLVKDINRNKNTVHKPIYITGEKDGIEVEIALQYNDSVATIIESYVNVINTQEGGAHVTGFKSALTRTINEYLAENDIDKKGVAGSDTRESLAAIIFIKMSAKDLQFEGQTKTKLGNSEVTPIVQSLVKEKLEIFLEENPREARRIMSKILTAKKARRAAQAAKEAIIRKGVLSNTSLPGKLADCQSQDPEESEIFIVEGDSAGGSAKQGRDRKFQAILPLRGKLLNTERTSLERIIKFNELKDLIVALGTGIGETFEPEKLRYHRIVIMTDADVDGQHIATLLLTFFYRHLPGLIKSNYLFIAQPPLYKIGSGKKAQYAYTETDRERILKEQGVKDIKLVNIQRYKGLGEMNPEQLWKTTMNPKQRILKQVSVEDAAQADKIFTTLMGKKVGPRRRFIQNHAEMARLDL